MTRQEFWTMQYNRRRKLLLDNGHSPFNADRIAARIANKITAEKFGDK